MNWVCKTEHPEAHKMKKNVDFTEVPEIAMRTSKAPRQRAEMSVDIPPTQGFGKTDSLENSKNKSDHFSEDLTSDDLSYARYNGKSEVVTKRHSKPASAPEQLLTLFAFRLAIMEKAASGAGKLAFVWATVVLLGGFSTIIRALDFWFVTILLITEGTRIFGRSHELEWQHASPSFDWTLRSIRRAGSAVVHAGTEVVHKSGHLVKTGISDLVHRTGSGSRRSPVPPDEATSNPATPFPPTSTPSVVESPPPPKSDSDSGSKSMKRARAASVQAPVRRTWSASVLPLLPWVPFLSAKGVSQLLYVMQLLSASVSVGISLYRLSTQGFTTGPGQENVVYSLNAFYALALLEALIFLIERAYWEVKINHRNLLQRVKERAELEDDDVEILQSFFYEVYAKSLNGSVFDGLDMDLVTYGMGLLQAEDANKVMGGAKVLRAFADRLDSFGMDTLRRIGSTLGVVDRLVEMLAWHQKHEIKVRLFAACIVNCLSDFRRNCSRIMAVAGSLENIASLFHFEDDGGDFRLVITQQHGRIITAEAIELRTHGLEILKNLAKDHTNCLKIGETRGLLATLVEFIDVRDRQFPIDREDPERRATKRSLQVLSLLAHTGGASGKRLRPAIANVVSAIPHLRDILVYRRDLPDLPRLAVDVLTSLALDSDAREIIGSTGGVISNLFLLFARNPLSGDRAVATPPLPTPAVDKSEDAITTEEKEAQEVARKAGEALTRLMLRNQKNCGRLQRVKLGGPHKPLCVLLKLWKTDQGELGICAAQILRSICAYSGDDANKRVEILEASEWLLKRVLTTRNREQEAALGVAAKAILLVKTEEMQSRWNIDMNFRVEIVKKLVNLLKHVPTSTKLPRIRRYTIELIEALMTIDEEFRVLFINEHLGVWLDEVLDTISDVENYCLFLGGAGLIRHAEDMESLVQKALDSLNNVQQ